MGLWFDADFSNKFKIIIIQSLFTSRFTLSDFFWGRITMHFQNQIKCYVTILTADALKTTRYVFDVVPRMEVAEIWFILGEKIGSWPFTLLWKSLIWIAFTCCVNVSTFVGLCVYRLKMVWVFSFDAFDEHKKKKQHILYLTYLTFGECLIQNS